MPIAVRVVPGVELKHDPKHIWYRDLAILQSSDTGLLLVAQPVMNTARIRPSLSLYMKSPKFY
jgi:hypothetical protein